MPKSSIKEYLSDIDGLRAVAVVLVVVFHFYEIYMSAGFSGIDVFFFISNFLIMGMLLKIKNTRLLGVCVLHRKNKVFYI